MNEPCRSLRFDPQAAGCRPKYGSSSSTWRILSRSAPSSIRGPARNCSSVLGRRGGWRPSLGLIRTLHGTERGPQRTVSQRHFSRLGRRRPPENTTNALEVGSELVEAKQVALRSCGICGGACVRCGHPDRQPNHIRDLTRIAFIEQRINGSLWRARDPQLLHLVGQRRPLEAEASCRSTSTSDNPVAFAEGSQNLFSLGLLQRIAAGGRTEG